MTLSFWLPFLLIIAVLPLVIWGDQIRDWLPAWAWQGSLVLMIAFFVVSALLDPERKYTHLVVAFVGFVFLLVDSNRRRLEAEAE